MHKLFIMDTYTANIENQQRDPSVGTSHRKKQRRNKNSLTQKDKIYLSQKAAMINEMESSSKSSEGGRQGSVGADFVDVDKKNIYVIQNNTANYNFFQ